MDLAELKRRKSIMQVVSVVAGLTAVGCIALYLQGQGWALALFVVAVLAGFASQIWFMAGLRRKGDS